MRSQLIGIGLIAGALAVVVGFAGLHGVASVNSARRADILVSDVQVDLAHVDADRNAIGAAVSESVVAHEPGSSLAPLDSTTEFGRAADALRADFSAAASRGLHGAVEAAIWAEWPRLARYVDGAQSMIATAATNPSGALVQFAGFDALSTQSAASTAHLQRQLDEVSNQADRHATNATRWARDQIFAIGLVAVLLLLALIWALGLVIIRALNRVGATAVAITGGDLDARTTIIGDDEIGTLGQALNEMADSLRRLFTRLGDEARRDAFGNQVAEAFEIADTVPDAYAQVELAMGVISDEHPMELLLADSSQANMGQKAVHPTAGAPGCSVATPYGCVAVRRGSTALFESSEALGACPKLRGREAGPCSAACIPVTFMGRALGVLHVTGPEHEPPGPEEVARLSTLGAQAGSTIGTVRSTESTVRQATTDGLTGLVDRRTIENDMHALLESGRLFAVAMADLDHFKLINDTYGHEAGDRALRLFSQVVQAHVRADDIVGRYGGEEFVLLFPGQAAAAARETLERLRAELASSQTDGSTPRFTASYGLTDSRADTSMDALLRTADNALAVAKRDGRDRIVLAEVMDAEAGAGSSTR